MRRGADASRGRARTPAAARRRRVRVAVIFGGRSVEHAVSLVSARAIIAALDPKRYEVMPVVIGRDGRWSAAGAGAVLGGAREAAELFRLARRSGARRAARAGAKADVVFPIVHGTGGEDGTLQGLLTLADVPFVGAGVLGSALGMDKVTMKALFETAGLPVARYTVVTRGEHDEDRRTAEDRAERHCGYPCFVKPSNGGSSVGVTKACDRRGLESGLRLALRYDERALVERAVDAREIECSVLGNERPEVSVAGEIVPAGEFYDYASKYQDEGSRLVIPAPLSPEQRGLVRDIALRAFRVLDLSGLARVDFFVDRGDGTVFLNEVNTLPGFTPISMYPKLWEASGVPFPRLVDRLIELAFERHARRGGLVTAFEPPPRGRRRPGA